MITRVYIKKKAIFAMHGIFEFISSHVMVVFRILSCLFVILSNFCVCCAWPFDRIIRKIRGNAYGFPSDAGFLSQDRLLYTRNSAYSYLRDFFLSKTGCIAIFWAIEGVNKAYITKHICEELESEIDTVYVNCDGIAFEDFKTTLYRKIDFEESCPNFIRKHVLCWLNPYTTFILDNLDGILEHERLKTVSMIEALGKRSRHGKFNVLLLLNKAENVHVLMRLKRIHYDIQLIGPTGCGLWTSDAFRLLNISQERQVLVDLCGTFTPTVNNTIDLIHLDATQEKHERDEGETLLNGVRNHEINVNIVV